MNRLLLGIFVVFLVVCGAVAAQFPGFVEWGYDRLEGVVERSPTIREPSPPVRIPLQRNRFLGDPVVSPNGKLSVYPVYAPSPTRYRTPQLASLMLEPGHQQLTLESATQVFASPVGSPRGPVMNRAGTPPAPYEFTQIHWLPDSSGWVLLRQRLQPELTPPEFRVFRHEPLAREPMALALAKLPATFVWDGILPDGHFVFSEGYYPFNQDKTAEHQRGIALWHPGSAVGVVRYQLVPPRSRAKCTLADVLVRADGKTVLALVNLPSGRSELWQLPLGSGKSVRLFAPDGQLSLVRWHPDGKSAELSYRPHCTWHANEPAGNYRYAIPD